MKKIFLVFIVSAIVAIADAQVGRSIARGFRTILREQALPWRIIGGAAFRALQAQQNANARQNAGRTHQSFENERRLFESTFHRPLNTPSLPLVSYHLSPSKEELYNAYKNAFAIGDTVVGIRMLYQAATMGLRDAQYDYGYYCTRGQFVTKDINKGNHFIIEAAKQDYPDALYYLGVAYYFGYEGFRKDSLESVLWFEKSAHEGCLMGQIRMGSFYYNSNNLLNAVNYWEMAANNTTKAVLTEPERQILGDVYYSLGALYYNGELGAPDKEKAVNYFTEGANIGNSYSSYILGLIYREVDPNLSCRYIKSSAIQGCVDAQAVYAYYRMVGYGTEKDSIDAFNWYKRAALNHNVSAICTMPYLYYEAHDDDNTIICGQRPECRDSADIQYLVGAAYFNKGQYTEAEYWWAQSAAKQFPDALWCMYILNHAIKSDTIAGHRYLEQACSCEHPDALCDMGCDYITGYMVEQNIEKGRELLRRAASFDNGLAYYNLGVSFEVKAINKKVDWATAAEYYRQGAELGCPEAQYSYGYCLKKGKGVRKDKLQAVDWFRKAALNGNQDAIDELRKMKIDIGANANL